MIDYNEDYFYFGKGNNENWWDHEVFQEKGFLKFKDRVYSYFDNELSIEKLLVELICDDNGNDFEYNGAPVEKRLDLLICYGYKKNENVPNVASNVMNWLITKNLMQLTND